MCVACSGLCDPTALGGLPGVLPGLSFDYSATFNATVTNILNGQLYTLDQSLTIANLAFNDATAQAAGALQLAAGAVTTIQDLQVQIASAAIDVLAGAELVINQAVIAGNDALAIALANAQASVAAANAEISAQLGVGSVLRLLGQGRATVNVTSTTGTVEASGGAWLQGHIQSNLEIANNVLHKIYTDNAAGLTIHGMITGAGEIEVTGNGWLKTLANNKIGGMVNLASAASQWIVDATGFSGASGVTITGSLDLTTNYGSNVVFDTVGGCSGSVHITLSTDFASAPRTGTVFSFSTATSTTECSLVITDSTGATQTIGSTSRRAGSGSFTFTNGLASYDLDGGAPSAGSMAAPTFLVAAFVALFALLR